MSDAERTVQRQLKIITEPSIAAIVELYFNKYNTHIPKGSTDSTGIREREITKSDRDSKTQQARERERERDGQAGRQESPWQPQATQARSVVIASSLECRWRSQHDPHFQPKLLSIVLRACCLYIVFAFNGFDLGIPTPWHCRASTWAASSITQTILGALDLNDLGSGAGWLPWVVLGQVIIVLPVVNPPGMNETFRGNSSYKSYWIFDRICRSNVHACAINQP